MNTLQLLYISTHYGMSPIVQVETNVYATPTVGRFTQHAPELFEVRVGKSLRCQRMAVEVTLKGLQLHSYEFRRTNVTDTAANYQVYPV